MNKKKQYQILLAILAVIVIFNLAIIIGSILTTPENSYTSTVVGSNVNGSVYRVEAGDMSSDETVVIILGMHPEEKELAEKINSTFYNITGENGSKNLTKKYVIYYVKASSGIGDSDSLHEAGEQLVDEFVVPNITEDDPSLVVDVHEVNPDYGYSNYVSSLSNRTVNLSSAVTAISNEVNLIDYQPSEGTSLNDITQKIADKGIDTILIGTSISDSISQKEQLAKNLIESLDGL